MLHHPAPMAIGLDIEVTCCASCEQQEALVPHWQSAMNQAASMRSSEPQIVNTHLASFARGGMVHPKATSHIARETSLLTTCATLASS